MKRVKQVVGSWTAGRYLVDPSDIYCTNTYRRPVLSQVLCWALRYMENKNMNLNLKESAI